MIRYGILGFGHHAVKRMIPGFAEARDSQLAGLWRRNLDKARENAREFSIPHVFETAEALCASPEIDAIFISSPDALHLSDVLLAAKHGKAILCEKPLGMNTGEVEQMLAAAKAANVVLGVAQNMRYYRSLALIRQWIAEGKVGKPVLAHSQFAYSAERSPREWIYDPALACGGPIGDVGVHCLDALRFVLQTNVTAVSTLAHSDAESGAVESYAVLALALASEAMATVTVTTRASYRSLVEVTGEIGVILCENGLTVDHPIEVVLRKGDQVLLSETVTNADAYGLMLDGFAQWTEGRGDYLAPASDGLHNQKVLDAAYASWRNGRREAIS
ncbi:1,5-anhydro-D-fructose reductase (1,5-anhydro-D-mannitol-forming) [Silvibacterium bohemicum]|uniref:1,5-anhydro-D-fructose reductase (1,5-anhydro-D-mannitol-forming) n=1 Tax=Silvibacterium bohemicum TaxID=1577686 RepID=A0A841JVT1_9BACT|nr:Gfo/Idh/MocA family oxidoreductase [Silvibacterium bohemicum]MBB6145456.1 1,5-anhydro-D-fructose reductase (1,5-anhydro-D-mannitol-forming) [Silvibacterium bohemicum]